MDLLEKYYRWSRIPSKNRACVRGRNPDEISEEFKAVIELGEQVYGLDINTGRTAFSLPDLPALPNLHLLSFYGWQFEHLPEFVRVHRLQFLDLGRCEYLRSLPHLSSLKELRELDLSYCKSLEDLPDLSSLVNLQTLDLRDCKTLRVLPDLSALGNLQVLNLSGCESLRVLPNLSSLGKLQTLDLGHCTSLEAIPDLSSLVNLQTLDLGHCESLHLIRGLSALKNLQTLSMQACESLGSIPDLSSLTNLRSLDLSWWKVIESLPSLSSLKGLLSLKLNGCWSLRSIPSLSALTSLLTLELRHCESLESLPDLSAQKPLQKLDLGGCYSLKTLPDLSALRELESLNISGCKLLPCLPNLCALKSLKTLHSILTPLVENKHELAKTALEEFEDDDPEFVAWVLAQTRARVSHEGFFKDFQDWCALVPRTKNPDELLRVVADGLQKCRGPDAPDTALPSLITAALKTEAGKLNAPAWRALFGCFDPSDPDDRAKLEGLLAELPPDRLLLEALGPCLDWLGQSATAEHAWALAFTEGLLAAHAPAVLRPLAPNVCLFFHRLGNEDHFRHWLQLLTDPTNPDTLDPVNAVLARAGVEQGDIRYAQAKINQIQNPELRDPVLEDLARALAATHPLEAGAALDALFSATRQADLARHLLAEPVFTAEPANIYRLLIIMEDDPEALTGLIKTTILNSDSPEFIKAVHETFPDHSKHRRECSEGLHILTHWIGHVAESALSPSVIEEILAEPDLRKALPEEDLRDYLATLRADPDRTSNLLRRAVLEHLAQSKVISKEANARLLHSFA